MGGARASPQLRGASLAYALGGHVDVGALRVVRCREPVDDVLEAQCGGFRNREGSADDCLPREEGVRPLTEVRVRER